MPCYQLKLYFKNYNPQCILKTVIRFFSLSQYVNKNIDKTFMKLLLDPFRDLKEKNNFYFNTQCIGHGLLLHDK